MAYWSHNEPLASANTKRPRPQESDDDEEYSSTSNSESDSWGAPVAKNSPKKSPRKHVSSKPIKKATVPVKVASKASILSLASNEIPGSESAGERLADIDSAILGKIKKALALGGHQGTGEAEAKRAMRLATKLMAQYNVNQADIVAAEEDSEKLKRAGQSTVSIRSTTSQKTPALHAWSNTLANAITTFFDCKSYSTRYDTRNDRTFYGLSEQTVAAAYAFEMVYNLILLWSAQNKNAKGRTGKNNYCHGVAEGLRRMAKEDRKQEKERVVKKEQGRLTNAHNAEEEERKRAMQRLEGPRSLKQEDEKLVVKVKVEEVPDEDLMPKSEDLKEDPKAESESDDDDDETFGLAGPAPAEDMDIKADFDDRNADLDQMLKDMDHDFKRVPESAQPSLSSTSAMKAEDEDTPWASSQQLTMFRDNATSIADEFLKQSDIKLRKGPRNAGPKLEQKQNIEAYRQGKRDARNIDVKRKRIKGADDE